MWPVCRCYRMEDFVLRTGWYSCIDGRDILPPHRKFVILSPCLDLTPSDKMDFFSSVSLSIRWNFVFHLTQFHFRFILSFSDFLFSYVLGFHSHKSTCLRKCPWFHDLYTFFQSSIFRRNVVLSIDFWCEYFGYSSSFVVVGAYSLTLLCYSCSEQFDGKQQTELLQDMLKSSQWVKAGKLSAALKSPFIRLCGRYAKWQGHIQILECYQHKFSIIDYMLFAATDRLLI
jgi:hypothetical protein